MLFLRIQFRFTILLDLRLLQLCYTISFHKRAIFCRHFSVGLFLHFSWALSGAFYISFLDTLHFSHFCRLSSNVYVHLGFTMRNYAQKRNWRLIIVLFHEYAQPKIIVLNWLLVAAETAPLWGSKIFLLCNSVNRIFGNLFISIIIIRYLSMLFLTVLFLFPLNSQLTLTCQSFSALFVECAACRKAVQTNASR